MRRHFYDTLKSILLFAALMQVMVPCRLFSAVLEGGNHQDYRVGIGDLLEIEVYDEPDLTREVRVLTDGKISLPLLGTIRAAERTVQELQEEIRRLLGAKYLVDPQVTVFVKEFSQIFIFGEVKNPGAFSLTGTMTVFEAITLAGGFTDVANPAKVKVIRMEDGRQVSFEVNIQNLTKNGDTVGDKELRSNDRVIVPRSFF